MAKPTKPNILVIWGDDIGIWNLSCYHRGMMGGRTPNIDRIAAEGAIFTDCYGQQSCTAGRAAFITGQHPFRTGLLTVGLPGAKIGLSSDDPTLAELLKPLGYVTGQFGKNHLGDRDEYLPHNHGFDEFFGNLYHLNAEEEPEDFDYPKDPEFRRQYGPRGVLDCKAGSGCRDTGPLTRERMETADDEFIDRSLEFIDRAVKDGKPFFVWANTTRMHVWTRLEPKWQGKSGYGLYADGMMEHDEDVGRLLHKLDELKIADNTIVIYTSDNGAQTFTYPDGGVIPFRGYKGTTWEGGFRVPALVRWPGHIKAGRIETGIWSHQDWLPTLVAVAGVPGIKEKLLNGYAAGGKTYKVHLDGYDQLGNLLGKELSKLNRPYLPTPAGVVIYAADYKWLCLARVTLHGASVAAQAVRRYVEACFRRQKPLTMGQALAAGLRVSLTEADVPVWLDTPLLDLSVDGNGRVDGVRVRRRQPFHHAQRLVDCRGGVRMTQQHDQRPGLPGA